MRRIFLVVVVFLLAVALYAQQAELPNSGQIRQSAQQYSTEVKTNSSQFQSFLADLVARNTSNKNLETFTRLQTEIQDLETRISSEENRVKNVLARGGRVTNTSIDRIDGLIKQHQAKIAELDAFIAGIQ